MSKVHAGSGPWLSVITVVLNAADTITDTIESVLGQQTPGVEYLILDGGSTDGTLSILERYRKRLAYLRSAPDGGIYPAMNEGIRRARGRWIALQNADDFYLPGAFDKVARAIEATPGAGVVYGDTITLWLEDRDRGVGVGTYRSCHHQGLGQGGAVDHRGMFVRADLQKAHPFDDRYRLAADYDLMLRLWKAGATWVHADAAVSVKRRGGASQSRHIITEVHRINGEHLTAAVADRVRRESWTGLLKLEVGNCLITSLLGASVLGKIKTRGGRGVEVSLPGVVGPSKARPEARS